MHRRFSIEQIKPGNINERISAADIIGLGFPIYGSDAPRIFHRFLDALPIFDNPKPVFGFVTQLAWSGDGCNFLKKSLGEKGYRLDWAIEFTMPNNIALGFSPLRYTAEYARFLPLLENNQKRIETFCTRIITGKPHKQHRTILDAALGWVQSAPFRWAHDKFQDSWTVDTETCISCGDCVRHCPVGNICMDGETPIYFNNCIYCMRCFNYCPTLAIHFMNLNNNRAIQNQPFQGPTPDFHPCLITKASGESAVY